MKRGNQNGELTMLRPLSSPGYIMGWIIRGVILLVLIIAFIWSQNHLIVAKEDIFMAQSVPKTFVGYTIAHVSDIHNSNLDVVGKVKSTEPDLILVTGGMAYEKGRVNKSIKDINALGQIAPTYYVLGDGDEQYRNEVISGITGAQLIEGTGVSIPSPEVDVEKFIDKYIGNRIIAQAEKGDEEAQAYIAYTRDKLASDSSRSLMVTGFEYDAKIDNIHSRLYDIIGTDKDNFQIVLESGLTQLNKLAEADIDMILSGSTHGEKQEGTGLSKGIYSYSGATLILNGGIGKPDGKGRMLNYPEIRVMTLSDGTIKDENPIERLLGWLMPSVGTKFDDDGGFVDYTYKFDFDRYGTTTQGANPGG